MILPFSNLDIKASLTSHAIPSLTGIFCRFGLVEDSLPVAAIN
jgi:hypothetical protein